MHTGILLLVRQTAKLRMTLHGPDAQRTTLYADTYFPLG